MRNLHEISHVQRSFTGSSPPQLCNQPNCAIKSDQEQGQDTGAPVSLVTDIFDPHVFFCPGFTGEQPQDAAGRCTRKGGGFSDRFDGPGWRSQRGRHSPKARQAYTEPALQPPGEERQGDVNTLPQLWSCSGCVTAATKPQMETPNECFSEKGREVGWQDIRPAFAAAAAGLSRVLWQF